MSRNFRADITADMLRACLDYDASTGLFRWRGGQRANQVAGSSMRSGYLKITIGGVSYLAHRLAWLYYYGEWPPYLIDHRDRDPSNNRISNLRKASSVQSGQNRAGAKGYYMRQGRYQGQIKINKKKHALGPFKTEAEARAAYVDAANQSFGEFSPFREVGS